MGTCWASGSWAASVWADNTWADAVVGTFTDGPYLMIPMGGNIVYLKKL
jgi:hypothetical protein